MKYLLAVVITAALAVPGWAQDSGDAPEHGVARISLLKGDVTVRRGDSGELVAAELNAPLVARDHVLTDEDSRAEVQLDWANFVRIASNSEIRMAELADRDFLVQVAAGTVTFRVLRDSNSQVEISTPTVAIRPRLQGTYRVTVRDDASTELTVRSGEVEIFSGQRTDYVRAGQTLIISGDPSNPQRTYRSAIPYDEWDRWNEARDRDLERGDSYKYISRDIYGAEDLYGHGRWVYDSPYGWVWVPTVSASWAPYRVGRWSWVDYYGWTWISGDPWGWAPYHYGRWYHASRYGWVWYPGEVRVRYYWRPALVAFFGWGSVNVGWVSLAPFEVYRPWYGRSRTTVVNNVTIVNNINVVNTYRNARFISGRTGVTSIVSNDFGRRRVTVNNYVVGNDRDFTRAGDAGRWLGREPSRENRQFSDRQVSPQVVTRVANRREVDRQFVSTRPDRDARNRGGGNTQQVEIRTPRSTPNQTALPADNARRADSQRNETARPQEGSRGRGANAAVPSNGAAATPNQGNNRGRTENPTGVAATAVPDNSRRNETPRQNEPVVFPRNEPERERQQGNRGRNESPTVAATPAPDNSRRNETPRQNEPVVFPRNEPERERQQGNRGRNENPTVAATPAPDNSRRNEAPRQNEPVVFPRTEPERERQQGNRGRNESPTVAATPAPDNSRRNEAPRQNEPVVFPRNEPARVSQPQNSGRNEGFSQRQSEPPRQSQASETSRRAEPPPQRNRPEEIQRPQAPANRPAPAPERERVRESAPPPQQQAPPAPRPESRNNPAPPPQASAPAPSPGPSSNSEQGNSGGGGGRGRGRNDR